MDDEDQLVLSLDAEDLVEVNDALSSNMISVLQIARHINEYLSKDGEGSIEHTELDNVYFGDDFFKCTRALI
eukprot:scaffold53751_cov37-Cyclotella_meneghiniana.AAC.3